MIPKAKIAKAKILVAAGEHSQRKIAEMAGVSRSLVHRIASGKYIDRPEHRKEEWEVDWHSGGFNKKYERCTACGALVQLPCLSCIIRKTFSMSGTLRFQDAESSIAKLDLLPQHQGRYEQVKAWRESQQDPSFTKTPDDWPFRKKFKS